MNRQSILSKTAKGLMETTGKTSDLSRDLRNLLKEIDGKVSVGQLQMRQEIFTESDFLDALRTLLKEGYVRETVQQQDTPLPPRDPAPKAASSGPGEDLDFTAISSKPAGKPARPPTLRDDIARPPAATPRDEEAAAKARAEADARARREAEHRAQREAEERARREAEERTQREAAERSRREAEQHEAQERARRAKEEEQKRWDAEAKAQAAELEEAIRRERAEAEEEMRRKNQERVRREEEERRHQEEEERRRLTAKKDEAEQEIRRREEEMRRREEDEEARAKQEHKARAETEAEATAQGRKEAREREKAIEEEEKRATAQERARQQAARSSRNRRRRSGLGKPIAAGLFLVLVISVVAVHFVPLDSAPYEKAAQEWLGQPVRIGTVNVALIPSPQLRFERVTIGKEAPMRIALVKASLGIGSVFEDRKALRRLEVEGATVPQEFLPGLLATRSRAGNSLGIERVTGKGIKLGIAGFALPEFEVNALLDAGGAVRTITLSNAERRLSATLQPQAGRVALEISAQKMPLPIGADLSLDEFSATGIIGRTEMTLNEFAGRALDGVIQGNARLRWNEGWNLDGELSVRQMDAAKIASPMLAGGRLEGKGVYAMRAAAPDKLFGTVRLEGTFTVQKGSITNVDMTRILQGGGAGGGTTLFSEMSGNVRADSGRIQVRQLRLAAGLLQAAGNIDVDIQKNLSGRVQVELRAQTVQARATLAVSGTLANPQFRRTN